MNIKDIIKITIILVIVAVAITFATAQSDWEQFQKDEVSSGQTANSAPVAAPDDMTTCDVQLALPSGGE
ncbi:MAG: hypothetical protein KAJ93_03210 [Methanosarcinales archaeon]|nr:hypothetical protein [Methanosarcinales archaeon]